MLFAALCTDKEGALQIRLDTRPTHVAYLDDLNARGILKVAGPFLGEDGKPNGSLVIIDAETKDAATAIFAEDPYAKAGLFASVDVKAWNWVFNKPE